MIVAIVARSVLNARRAAAEAAKQQQLSVRASPPVVALASPSPHRSLPTDEQPDVPVAPRRRGHATKDENGKWQPTAPYPNGFAKAPPDTQFKPGGKGGPGRPKGSVSHDALMQKHLKQKREVSVGGRRQKVATRELLVMSMVKAALEGKDKHARSYALASSERLYPSREVNDNGATAPALSASDALSLVEYEQELRERIRAEVLEEMRREREASAGDAL